MFSDKKITGLEEVPVSERIAAELDFVVAQSAEGKSYKLSADKVIALAYTLPVAANNAAALALPLAVGQLYRTATGEVRIVV